MTEERDWAKILGKHEYEILERIFVEEPPDITWFEIQGLLDRLVTIERLAGNVRNPPGAPVTVQFGEAVGVFHEPNPYKQAAKGNIRNLRKLLTRVGVVPRVVPRSGRWFPWGV